MPKAGQKQAQSVALVVVQPATLTPAEHQMFDSIAMRYARSELSPSWARGKPDNVFIAMVNGHALGLHPAVAVNNGFVVNGHYDLFGQAFLGLAQGRDPAFRYEIEEWDEEKIKLVGWREPDGKHPEIALTAAQLRKNPATAKNPSFQSNPKDHLMWKASKRLVRLVTPAVTMGLPLPTEDQVEAPTPEAPKPRDVANELDEALAKPLPPAHPAPVAARATAEREPSAAARPDPVLALSGRIRNLYGDVPRAVALEKVSFLYSEMMKERTGAAKEYVFKKAADIGAEAASEVVAWLDQREAAKGPTERGDGTEGEHGSTEPAGGTEPAPAREPGDDAEEPPPPDEPEAEAQEMGFEGFMRVVQRARKLFAREGRLFVKEAPPKSGKLWYTDQETFSKLGYTASQKVSDNGEVSMEPAALAALGQVLADYCDQFERKGR